MSAKIVIKLPEVSTTPGAFKSLPIKVGDTIPEVNQGVPCENSQRITAPINPARSAARPLKRASRLRIVSGSILIPNVKRAFERLKRGNDPFRASGVCL